MTPGQFRSWRKEMGLSRATAGEALGISRETVINYERGKRRDGELVEIPKYIELACTAVRFLKAYSDPAAE